MSCGAALSLAAAATVWAATISVAQAPGSVVARHLAVADSARAADNDSVALSQYAAALRVDPENSKATFRLAQLRRDDPPEAERLFRRYLALEPADPWGYMALGDQLGRRARYGEALAQYDRALGLAPSERDAVVGRARILARAGRTESAIGEYERWLTARTGDAEAWRELARQYSRAGRHRAAAAALERSLRIEPDASASRRLTAARAVTAAALEPLVATSRDSDGNLTSRLGLAVDWMVGGRGRLGLEAARHQLEDGIDRVRTVDVSARGLIQPIAQLRLDGAAGGNVLDLSGQAATEVVVPTGRVRARWRGGAGRPSFDARVQRVPLDASATLIAARVVRTELSGMLDVPVAGALKLRGSARVADLRDRVGGNTRTGAAGMVVLAAAPSVEVSAQLHRVGYAHATAAGYFAPRLIQAAQVGLYAELERGPVTLAFDLSAGAQRVAEHGASVGAWKRAFAVYAQMSWALRPATELRCEVEGYDAPAAISGVATGAGWRYGSVSLSLRWAL